MPSTLGITASAYTHPFLTAVFGIDATNSISAEQAAVNIGTGGATLNARYGSSTGSDTNDPLLLTHTGVNYMYFAGNNAGASVPDSAAISPVQEVECIARVQFDSYTGNHIIIRKTSGTQDLQWDFNSSSMRFVWWTTGGTINAPAVSSSTLTANTRYWVRCTANSTATKFFYAADSATIPTSWTQLGTDQTGITSAIRDSATTLEVGVVATGRMYRAIMRTAIDGTDKLDIDFTANTNHSSFTCTTGQTVTINRATSGRKSAMVTRAVWLLGTDDYFEVPDDALLDFSESEDFTIVAVVRMHATPTSGGRILSKESATAGWYLSTNGTTYQPSFVITDGTITRTANGSTETAGTLVLLGGVRSAAANIYAVNGSTLGSATTDTTTTTLANASVLRVGRNANGTNYADMELLAVAVYRSALTTNDLSAIKAYFGV